jgi:hypothetical protein
MISITAYDQSIGSYHKDFLLKLEPFKTIIQGDPECEGPINVSTSPEFLKLLMFHIVNETSKTHFRDQVSRMFDDDTIQKFLSYYNLSENFLCEIKKESVLTSFDKIEFRKVIKNLLRSEEKNTIKEQVQDYLKHELALIRKNKEIMIKNKIELFKEANSTVIVTIRLKHFEKYEDIWVKEVMDECIGPFTYVIDGSYPNSVSIYGLV